MQNIILNKTDIENKIRRIAYQIYETFSDEEEIIVAGISKSGYILAEKIASKLEEISQINTLLCEVKINKQKPSDEIFLSIDQNLLDNKCLVLVDDVLNSGETMIFAIKYLLNFNLKKFKTSVLIDRNHKNYPVKIDFKGLSLSTSLQENIEVVFENDNSYAFLS